ncbi:hypothetical protein CHS0354_019486, partial [Potamilus streckersoni]
MTCDGKQPLRSKTISLSNAGYGKTVEKICNLVYIESVNSRKRCSKLVCFVGLFFWNASHQRNHVLGQKYKTNLMLNKHVFVGAVVLETSKWLMYKFFIKKIWANLKFLFMDVDSL